VQIQCDFIETQQLGRRLFTALQKDAKDKDGKLSWEQVASCKPLNTDKTKALYGSVKMTLFDFLIFCARPEVAVAVSLIEAAMLSSPSVPASLASQIELRHLATKQARARPVSALLKHLGKSTSPAPVVESVPISHPRPLSAYSMHVHDLHELDELKLGPQGMHELLFTDHGTLFSTVNNALSLDQEESERLGSALAEQLQKPIAQWNWHSKPVKNKRKTVVLWLDVMWNVEAPAVKQQLRISLQPFLSQLTAAHTGEPEDSFFTSKAVVELVAQYVCVFNITGGPANASDASKPWPVLSALRWATSLSSVFKVVAASKVVPSDLMEQLSAVVSHDHISEEHAELSYVASVHLNEKAKISAERLQNEKAKLSAERLQVEVIFKVENSGSVILKLELRESRAPDMRSKVDLMLDVQKDGTVKLALQPGGAKPVRQIVGQTNAGKSAGRGISLPVLARIGMLRSQLCSNKRSKQPLLIVHFNDGRQQNIY
jgi:hypothetical protein